MQSGFGHVKFFKKLEQYLVVPKEAFRSLPSTEILLTEAIALKESSLRKYVTYALALGP